MKTSNKILIVATLVVIGYLLVYDTALKAEYVKGDFKKPHYRMHQLSLSNFNIIEHNAANIIGMQIEKGPYGVWIDDYIKDKVKVSQHGQTLQVDYISKENFSDYKGIIISCPDVISITANPFINPEKTANERYLRRNGTTMIIDYFPHGTIGIIGFEQPVMTLQANEFTEFELQKNTLTQLNAKIGNTKKGNAGLTITADNKITGADIQVPGRSTLTLDNVYINKVTYKIADSADVHLTGKSVRLLDHP